MAPARATNTLTRRIAGRLPSGARDRFAELATTYRAAYRAKVWYLAQKCDTFLISFPKCGRTWLRQMVGLALADEFGLLARPIAFTSAKVDHPGVCPTVEQLRAEKELSAASKITDPWDTPYKIVCGDDDIYVVSFGPAPATSRTLGRRSRPRYPRRRQTA